MLAALIAELSTRVDTAASCLADVNYPEVRARARSTEAELAGIAERLRALSGQAPQDAVTDVQRLRRYRALAFDMRVLERSVLAFLLNMTEADRRLTALCKQLASEIGWADMPPLTRSGSRVGFSILQERVLLSLPVGEDRRLLAIPDLCHELGHSLYWLHTEEFVGDFQDILLRYSQNAKNLPVTPGVFLNLWRAWAEEFACDLVGTYLAGPAYLAQHLRLIYLSRDPYAPSSKHPADSARLEMIVAQLRRAGYGADADDLSEEWDRFLRLNLRGKKKSSRPRGHRGWYPEALLEAVSARVPAACAQVGLRPFADAPAGGLLRLAARAWQEQAAHLNRYPDWERQALERLWHTLQVPAP